MARTRIRKLYISGFQQFKDVVLDFTHPETGDALDRICLIGRNGTGKSTVLRMLDQYLQAPYQPFGAAGRVSVELEVDRARSLVIRPNDATDFFLPVWAELGTGAIPRELLAGQGTEGFKHAANRLHAKILGYGQGHGVSPPTGDMRVYSPAEAQTNQGPDLGDVPSARLNEALALFKSFPRGHTISSEHISEMWRVLIFLVKKRENDRQEFETRPESLVKTKGQLIAEFDAANPSVLHGLADLWNRLLAPAGLEFDVQNAQIPVQLTENLQAYIRLASGSHDRVPYGQLSTGIRNFMFRMGHLFLLYFHRKIESGFVLIDEPESSLFPDFLFDLMGLYDEILGPPGATNTQLFMATHNPIVAAQFEPYERIVLEWGDDGGVTASKGAAPKGDDPNDLLLHDFHLPEVMGPEGRKAWKEFLSLRKQIRAAPPGQREALVLRAADIAQRYGFETS